jgi:hypothetical protein
VPGPRDARFGIADAESGSLTRARRDACVSFVPRVAPPAPLGRKVDEFADGLRAEELATMRAERAVMMSSL